jgi:hypothetical protein
MVLDARHDSHGGMRNRFVMHGRPRRLNGRGFGIVMFDNRRRNDGDRLGLRGWRGFDRYRFDGSRLGFRRRRCSNGLLHEQLNRKLVADALGLGHEWMRERRSLNRFRGCAFLPQLATAIARKDLLCEGLHGIDRQHGRRHIVTTVSGEHVRSFTGSHHKPFSTDTFKRRT